MWDGEMQLVHALLAAIMGGVYRLVAYLWQGILDRSPPRPWRAGLEILVGFLIALNMLFWLRGGGVRNAWLLCAVAWGMAWLGTEYFKSVLTSRLGERNGKSE
jgi:hypothetical protein